MSTHTDLRTGLRELADDAPHGTLRPDDLWRSGVRRQRRRRAGTAGALVSVVVLVVGLGALVQRTPPDPAPVDVPFEELGIPRTIHPPDPWSEGTRQTGPPGPLAAVAWDQRNRPVGFGGVTGDLQLFGVPAVDGAARFIDFPEQAGTSTGGVDQVALSPDGYRVAVARVREGGPDAGKVLGWDVYDADENTTTPLRAPRLRDAALSQQLLGFSGDSAHLLTSVTTRDDDQGRKRSLVVWDAEWGQHEVVRTDTYPEAGVGSHPTGFAWTDGRNRVTTLDPATGETATVRIGRAALGDVAFADDGQSFAYLSYRTDPPTLLVDRPAASGREVPVGRLVVNEILGWREPRELVVLASTVRSRGRGVPVVTDTRTVVLDLETGPVETLDLRSGDADTEPLYATDLFANPLTQAEPPEELRDPRWWLWFWPFNLLAALVAVGLLVRAARLRWRRRGRA